MKYSSTTLIVLGAVFAIGFALTALILVPFSDRSMSEPTAVARSYSELEARGRELYLTEGCTYCHSQQVRSLSQDRPFGTRPSQPGDYANEQGHPMGRLRIGPDLTYVGDRHPDEEWYVDYLSDPRKIFPDSVKPTYDHLSQDDLRALAAYLVTLRGGYLDGDDLDTVAEEPSPFAQVPAEFAMANPLDRTADVMALGKEIFESFCASCHGMAGDGTGPAGMALKPPPANFTNPIYRQAEDAYLYWRVTKGVPGTGMPPWESVLTEEERWAVVHYLRVFHAE